MKMCPCGCAMLPPTGRCLRRRLEQRIATLTRRRDGLRPNRCTKGFRTTWENREGLREELEAIEKRTSVHHNQ